MRDYIPHNEQRKALRKKSFEQREIRIPQRTGQTKPKCLTI